MWLIYIMINDVKVKSDSVCLVYFSMFVRGFIFSIGRRIWRKRSNGCRWIKIKWRLKILKFFATQHPRDFNIHLCMFDIGEVLCLIPLLAEKLIEPECRNF